MRARTGIRIMSMRELSVDVTPAADTFALAPSIEYRISGWTSTRSFTQNAADTPRTPAVRRPLVAFCPKSPDAPAKLMPAVTPPVTVCADALAVHVVRSSAERIDKQNRLVMPSIEARLRPCGGPKSRAARCLARLFRSRFGGRRVQIRYPLVLRTPHDAAPPEFYIIQ